MTQGLITRQYVEDIAEAIRFKNNENRRYYPSEMAEAIMNIPTGGGGLDLSTELVLSSDKTSTTGEVTLTAVLTANYDDLTPSDVDLHGYLEGATINFYDENDTLLYSSITNSEGIAIANIILTGTTSLYCSFEGTSDYQACISDSVSIEVVGYLFYDACNSATGLQNYGASTSIGSTSVALSFDTDNYILKRTSSGDTFTGVPITALDNQDNFKIRLKLKLSGTNAYNQIGLMIREKGSKSKYDGIRLRGDSIIDRFMNTTQSSTTIKTGIGDVINNYHYLEVDIRGAKRIVKLLDTNENIIVETEYTTQEYSSSEFLIFINTNYNGNSYIQEVKAQSYLFFDDCTVDNTAQYTLQQIKGNANATLTFNNNEKAYLVHGTSTERAIYTFGDTILQNGMKISADIKLMGATWSSNGLLGWYDPTNPTQNYMGGFVQGETYFSPREYVNNVEYQLGGNNKWSGLSTSDYNHHELTYQNGVLTYTITNPNGVSKTISNTEHKNWIGSRVGLFIETNRYDLCYVKNIVVEAL